MHLKTRTVIEFDRLGNSICIRCKLCEETFTIPFPIEKQLAYTASCLNGVNRRQALAFVAPNLSTNDRDLIISNCCSDCLDEFLEERTDCTPYLTIEIPEPQFDQGPEEEDPF